jgi:hypothetical protein
MSSVRGEKGEKESHALIGFMRGEIIEKKSSCK